MQPNNTPTSLVEQVTEWQRLHDEAAKEPPAPLRDAYMRYANEQHKRAMKKLAQCGGAHGL